MRLNKQQQSSTVMMNITPLIDIVFLLIIFFVTVSQITDVNEEPLTLPSAQGEKEQLPAKIIININRSNDILISGKKRTIGETVQIVSNELVRMNNDPAMLKITIRSDKDATTTVYNQIVGELKQLNITNTAFSVASE